VSGLSADAIAAHLSTRAYGRSLEVKGETGSTNDDAREAALRGAPRGHVVVADAQHRGRGAHGRTWSSPQGKDLYVSIVERLEVEPQRIAPLTLAVGLGVAEAAEAIAPPLSARVKWPNDVWSGRRKIAGVLVEASSIGSRIEALVIGIGLNVNRSAFEGKLAENASSLLLELRRVRPDAAPIDRERALAELLVRVERWVDRFVAEGTAPIVEALEERLALRGEAVRCDEVEGVLLGIAPSGAATIATANGVREFVAGTMRPRSVAEYDSETRNDSDR
jgi:BirA family biotin operon repressor/biotin-[acetyl-CoA-carboxylase] ligase